MKALFRHNSSRILGRAFTCTLALAIVPALCSSLQAQGSRTSSAIEFNRMADQLKPGQWVWAPEVAPAGPLLVYVDLSRQVATVYRNGLRFAVSTVSTGKPGHETPTGVFTILQKDRDHHSKTYSNAPMPYQERLTWDGVAMHAGGLPGQTPLSRGWSPASTAITSTRQGRLQCAFNPKPVLAASYAC